MPHSGEAIIRCPYCRLKEEFRPMVVRTEGWLRCESCGTLACQQVVRWWKARMERLELPPLPRLISYELDSNKRWRSTQVLWFRLRETQAAPKRLQSRPNSLAFGTTRSVPDGCEGRRSACRAPFDCRSASRSRKACRRNSVTGTDVRYSTSLSAPPVSRHAIRQMEPRGKPVTPRCLRQKPRLRFRRDH